MTNLLFIGTWELVAIVAVIVLLFGGKKIPELMQGVGKGVKSFKKGMQEVEEEINSVDKPVLKDPAGAKEVPSEKAE